MKLLNVNQIYFNKKTTLNQIFNHAKSFSETLNISIDKFYFYIDEFDMSRRSPINTITKRYSEMEEYVYEYQRFPKDKKLTRAISNLPQFWNEYNEGINNKYIDTSLIEALLEGIPRSFSPFHFSILFSQEPDNSTSIENNLFFPKINETSVAMVSKWNNSGRTNYLTIQKRSNDFDISNCDDYPLDLGDLPEKIDLIKNTRKYSKNEIIKEQNNEIIGKKEEVKKIIMTNNKLNNYEISGEEISNEKMNYYISYKEILKIKFKKLRFRYITKESRKDYYVFQRKTLNNNILELVTMVTPHSRMFEFNLIFRNLFIDIPLMGTKSILPKDDIIKTMPRLPGDTEENVQRSLEQIYVLIEIYLNEIIPRIDLIIGKTPSWFYD
ncbi:MAG: hypothetical protein PQJ44_06180 [Sphaerochaetaceae bacterium]|nr:hypothetical protein [Sphaerochaetaceae bacterium]